MAIAVAEGGEIVLEEAFGWANQESEIKATPHTVYPTASLSKSLTATGIMVLAERQEIQADDPVEDHIAPTKLTAYEGQASEVTIRRVLNMTSGIPHGYDVCDDRHKSPALKRFISRYGITAFPPGEMQLYSNFSYAILELIIENVSGRSYADFMKTEVFEPLGMTHTSVGIQTGREEPVATKYGSDNRVIPHNYFVPAAAGGIYSSAHDLIRYGMFHLRNHLPNQKAILEDGTLAAMHADKDKNLQSATMASGWGSVTLDDGLVWVLSNGSIEGATSMLSLVPHANLAVVCLTNVTSRSRITDQIALEITDALLPNFTKKVEAFMKRFESASAFESYTPVSQLIGQWEGSIISPKAETPIRMVFHDNGKIHVRIDKRHRTLLSSASVRHNELKGDFRGTLPNEEGLHREHTIDIHVRVKNGRMYGVATAKFEAEHGTVMLPSYISLVKR
jgi:CubicO group peptidase (beta-lactamase class C family)